MNQFHKLDLLYQETSEHFVIESVLYNLPERFFGDIKLYL